MSELKPKRTPSAGLIGPDETLIALGLVLLTTGLWPTFGAGALVAPGLVLLWVALPPRKVFLVRPETPGKGRT